MKIYKTKESESRQLALLKIDEEKETVDFVDITNIKLHKIYLDEWINLIHNSELIDAPVVFGFVLHWGLNDMRETSDGINVVRNMNSVLSLNRIATLEYDDKLNSHVSADINEDSIVDILNSNQLEGVKERMRAYDFKLVFSHDL